MTTPKYVRINVLNLPTGILQTTYYAHSGELIGDTLVLDVHINSPISGHPEVSLNDPLSSKFDLAPLRRCINIQNTTTTETIPVASVNDTFFSETEIDDDLTQDSRSDIFVPIQQPSKPKEIFPIEESDEEETCETIPENEARYYKKRRYSSNVNGIWIQKRRKTRRDKGKMRGIECNVCMNGRTILHTCKVCQYSYCQSCFDQFKEKDLEVDICSVCKREF